jgi:hypothetical protein
MRTIWKLLGLAGILGVAAGGVLVARDQRRRRAYTPDEIRARLQQRLAEADDES